MERYNILVEQILEERYSKEPLAASILAILCQEDPSLRKKVLDHFDTFNKHQIDSKVEDIIDKENANAYPPR